MPQIRRPGLTTRSDRRFPVAIVGGGASGTILAAQLARRGIRSVLIDGSGRAGRGVAYSTTEPAHVLNVRAEGMSAWADEPDQFANRFEREGGDRRGFAERRLFGRYLGEILDQAVATGRTEVVEETATSGTRQGGTWQVSLDDGSSIEASALVLAAGNQEPASLDAFRRARHRFIRDPWGEEARAAVADVAASGGGALLVGTGLTMVDLVLSLDAAGHRGKIVAMSRRGLVPRSHGEFAAAPVERPNLKSSIGDLFGWLRRRGAEVGWRAAVDSLRPHSHALWEGLGPDGQRRFLRHARPWWDVHRHRIAPEVAATIARLIGEGRLEVVAGRITEAREADGALEVTYQRRGARDLRTEAFAYAFNCTGPLHSISRTKNPLLRNLLDSGQVRPDHLDIGLETGGTCRVGEHLWAMGPLTKGRYWEITAVPDIREQAAQVADDIEREIGA